MKLTDTQLVLLSAASQREDGAVQISPSLKGDACRKVIGKLLSERLIEEIPAQGSVPVWRRDPDEGQFALALLAGIMFAVPPAAAQERAPGEVKQIASDLISFTTSMGRMRHFSSPKRACS